MKRTRVIAYFVVVVVNSLFIYSAACDDETNECEVSKKKWVSQLFSEAETAFELNSNVENADCQRDFLLYKLHLRNQSIWAIKMMESSEWPSIGIFSGRLDHLGDYDECLSVSSYGINGQYCLAQVAYDNLDENPDYGENAVEYPDQKISVWEALALYRSNPVRVDRRRLRFALCIPSSCRPSDLKISLNNVLPPIFLKQGFNVSVDVDSTLCKTSQHSNYPPAHYIVRWMLIVIFFLSVSSTCSFAVFNMNKNADKPIFWYEIINSFSIIENFKKLKNVNPETDCVTLHFMKFVSMILVVFSHRLFIYSFFYPKFNAETWEEFWNWGRLLLSHTTSLDVFFAITGFLTFRCNHQPMKRGGLVFLFVSIVTRWIRMVPVFGVLMLYIVYILPYTGEGPLWDYKILNEVSRCEQSWWTSLLAINNIVKTDQQCLIVSWYISVDMQLAVIGVILLYVYSKNEKLGILWCILVIVGAMVITSVVAYANEYHGVGLIYLTAKDLRDEKEFTDFYVTPYPRIIPYLIGFLSAVASKILKENHYKFSATQGWLLFISTLIMSEGSMIYASSFYTFGRAFSRVEHALFASLHRLMYISVFAVLFCIHFVSGLGIFNKLTEWRGFAPLGRLTYTVFLLNTMVQLYQSASHTQPVLAADISLIWITFGDIIVCYAIGLVLHIFVEAPVTNISKIMKKRLLAAFMKPRNKDEKTISLRYML